MKNAPSSKSKASMMFPAAVLGIVAMMVLPLPAFILDILLAANIGAAVLLLLSAINAKRVLELSSFPSVLLILTLFRLGLNVSTTRLILGSGEAGGVISAFGRSVTAGSLVVGLVVFGVLSIVQFVVIAQGSSRVSEVAARFALDAMPGKQMAVDADLNAGIITDDQAKARREEIAAEADYMAAMDGSGKFVKGDAVAGVIITAVNLIGGLAIGSTSQGLSIGEAASKYSMLTVGDGLVSQIPALLISIAAGIVVTRSSVAQTDLGSAISEEFSKQTRAFQIGGVALLVLGALPGLPFIPFVFIGGLLVLVSMRAGTRSVVEPLGDAPSEPELDPDDPVLLARSMRVEPIGLELASDMVDLVDPTAGGDLLDRVRGLRRKVAMDLGLMIPAVRTRDNADLEPGAYAVFFHGVAAGQGHAPQGHVLVIDDDLDRWPGEQTVEPVFGLPVKWVPESFGPAASASGATVVDRASVITTHVAELVTTHAADLLARQDVKDLLDTVAETDPAVIEDLQSASVPLPKIQWVLQDLLSEQVSIRDVVRILEQVSAFASTAPNPADLAETVRQALGSAICEKYVNSAGKLSALTLDPQLELALSGSINPESDPSSALNANDLNQVLTTLIEKSTVAQNNGHEPVLVCAPHLRRPLVNLLKSLNAAPPVLSYREVPATTQLETVGTLSSPQTEITTGQAHD